MCWEDLFCSRTRKLFICPFLLHTWLSFSFPCDVTVLWNLCEELCKQRFSKRLCHLACRLWAGPYPASISLRVQSQALWGRIRETEGERSRRRRGFVKDQSDPPDTWILWNGGPSGQMCTMCRHLCSPAVREDLLRCLSPNIHGMVIGHDSGTGDTDKDLM